MTTADTFLDAAESFAEQAAALPTDLSGPGLGEWDLRALVGHTSRALVTVSTYVRRAAEEVALASAVDYYLAVATATVDPAAITERGRQAGAALGDDPADAVRRLVDAVTADLAATTGDRLVPTIGGGMRLRDYLPTRTFELVVHGLDIAAATQTDWRPPADALAEAVRLAAEIALRGDRGTQLLRLVTGRDGGGFSVV